MYQENVREAVGGLKFGAPRAEGPLCILPLHGTTKVKARYVLLEQAIERGTLTITEVSEGGSVPFLHAVNKGPWPVLIFDGEELIGAKQNRIANATILVGVGKTVLPVSCVEQGRWSHRSRAFSSGTYASHPKLRSEKERQVREHLLAEARRREAEATAGVHGRDVGMTAGQSGRRDAGTIHPAPDLEPQSVRAQRFRSDQGAVWNEVERMNYSLGIHSPTSAMADAYQAGKDDLDKTLRKLALDDGAAGVGADTAVGVVVFVGGRFVCLDLLRPAKRFGRLYQKLLRGYALEAQLHRAPAAKDFDPEAATLRLLAELMEAGVDDQPGADLGFDLRLETKQVSGSGLLWDDELIQLSVFPKATV
ncbi:MAG: hypothetical protein JXA87_16045 [Thermoleophilia bacterium]|nr:hypothetical protein [Thermoleophilia bacterium]